VREREDANRTREAGHLDEIEGVVANTLNLFRHGASLLAKTFGVRCIVWLGLLAMTYPTRVNVFVRVIGVPSVVVVWS
jgi:hypothetical protein